MIDPAFKGVATKVGMTIWRIEVSSVLFEILSLFYRVSLS